MRFFTPPAPTIWRMHCKSSLTWVVQDLPSADQNPLPGNMASVDLANPTRHSTARQPTSRLPMEGGLQGIVCNQGTWFQPEWGPRAIPRNRTKVYSMEENLVAGFHIRFGPPSPFLTTLTVYPSPDPSDVFQPVALMGFFSPQR
jgi:hypothetical protein